DNKVQYNQYLYLRQMLHQLVLLPVLDRKQQMAPYPIDLITTCVHLVSVLISLFGTYLTRLYQTSLMKYDVSLLSFYPSYNYPWICLFSTAKAASANNSVKLGCA